MATPHWLLRRSSEPHSSLSSVLELSREGTTPRPSTELPAVTSGFLDSQLGVSWGQVSPPPHLLEYMQKTFALSFVFPEKLDVPLGL